MTMDTIRDTYRKGVYFLSDSTTFSYAATCLADGLNQLGVPIFSNISYGDELITDFRFEATPDKNVRNGAHCIVIDLQDTDRYCEQVLRLETRHCHSVALSIQDNVGNFCIEGVDAFLCPHENRYRTMAGPRVPIGFGLSSAMIRKSESCCPGTAREAGFLYNFRPSLNQDLRACLDLVLLPVLKRYLPVNERLTRPGRWNDDYFALLRSSFGCLAYGGTFEQDFTKNEFFMRSERFREFSSCIHQQRDTVILRWDSWRFWESLVCGCLTLHLDFDEYGFMLPVQPENWKHYVGINLADIHRDIERLMDERERLPEIAWNGRLWALQHYSPLAAAKRFLQQINKEELADIPQNTGAALR